MMNRFSRRSEPVKGEVTVPTVKFIPASNQESQYLQAAIGRVLVAGITQVLASRCDDPVDALGRFLLKHDENRIQFEKEERVRLEHKNKVKLQPTRQELDEMRQRFEEERKQWTLDNTVDDKLFCAPPPPPPPPKPIQEETVEEMQVELAVVDPDLTIPDEGSGISAIDNAIHGSQELRDQAKNASETDEGVTIADLEQDAILASDEEENDVDAEGDAPTEAPAESEQ
ncbi:hypothetical protein BDR26DRAFT_1004145 [Obelidium mucronatum]|nr:hypothetical protein BDR26DRAFT_1004145 [Obelidium mucronatum]